MLTFHNKLTRASLFVLGLVILCFVYFVFVTVWLSVTVQSIAWKRLVSEMIYYVFSGTLNSTHSLTHT